MNERAKVWISCSLGALIGAFVALQVNRHLCWLGFALGGLVGYLAYDPVEVMRAIPIAWEKTRCEFRLLARDFSTFAKWKHPFLYGGTIFAIPLTYWFWSSCPQNASDLFAPSLAVFVVSLLASGAILRGLAIVGSECRENSYWVAAHENGTEYIYKDYKKQGFVEQPVTYRNMTRWACLGLVTIFCLPFIFTRYLFRLIHSEMRLLCMVDAALGATVGYCTGHALMGMAAGGIFGVMNYEVVTVRWLKLVPAKKPA